MTGQLVKAVRERSGLSAAELARRVGTSRGYIHDVEHGRRRPSAAMRRRIAEALHIPVIDLMEANND